MTEQNWMTRAVEEYRGGRPLALLFDYDGTLTPIVAHPSLAVLPEASRELLARLGELDRVAVGVLSGRALPYLEELVGLSGVLYAGSGGMQIDTGRVVEEDPAVAEFDRIADVIVATLSEVVRQFPGTWVERKPGCLSAHYRRLTPVEASAFRGQVGELLAFLAEAAPPLRVRDVSKALEVSLAGAWTKGDAADRLLTGLGPGVFPVYAGDGANDEEAVGRVNDLGGVTVGVGPDAPAACRFRVPVPDALAADLARLVDTLSGRPWRGPADDRLSSIRAARGGRTGVR